MKLLIFISLYICSSLATNITYENVTQANFTELQDREVAVPGLSHLFVMSRNFVDIVFQPFSVIEEFIFRLVSSSGNQISGDFLGNLANDWQQLASFEVGFMVCLVFGLLFVIFVPLVGLIMCCCRTCCNNCGGKMEQSVKRAKSNWRYCFCGTLFVFTIFMGIPCIFVFLTNVWASQALEQIPVVTSSALQDLNNYITNVPVQVNHVLGEYGKLNTSLRNDIANINESLGVPIRDSFLGFTQPTLDDLTALSDDTEDARDALMNVEAATAELNAGIDNMNSNLTARRNLMDSDLNTSACRSIPACQPLIASTSALEPTGADFSSLDSLQNELNSINNTLNQFDINDEVDTILGTINDIPELVVNSSTDATSQVLETLNSIDGQLEGVLDNLPVGTINDFGDQIDSLGDSIADALGTYNNDYDVYRYVAGAVLASVIAVIVLFYWLGMLAGTFSFSPYSSERSGFSNCGGIFVMAAVGFSFIFSWLLMILVIITFTLGGHGERYICQNLESPYEGLRFADRIINRTGGTGDFQISLFSTVRACEENRSIYEAAGLENTYNVTEVLQDAISTVDDFQGNLNNLSLDLTNIDTFPPSIQQALNSTRNAGLDNINFTSYLNQISMGLTQEGLVEYAESLNNSADQIAAVNPGLADTIRGHSYAIVLIQQNQVAPLSQSLDNLNSSILRLQEISNGFNDTINNLEDSLRELNTSIQNDGADRVLNVTIDFANSIIDDVLGYANYAAGQLTDRLGACRPIFVVYTKLTQVLCSYLIELLNGFWFSLGWCVFFLIPSAIVGMKLAKFYRRMPEANDKDVAHWNDMEMESMPHINKNDDKLVEVERALNANSSDVEKSSDVSVIRSFRAASAKNPVASLWVGPEERTSRSAASKEDEVIRRWNETKTHIAKVVEEKPNQSIAPKSTSPERKDLSPAHTSSLSSDEVMGESQAEIRSTRNVTSHAHLLQPSVESRDTRRTISDVRNATELLMRWKDSSKVHPEQYY